MFSNESDYGSSFDDAAASVVCNDVRNCNGKVIAPVPQPAITIRDDDTDFGSDVLPIDAEPEVNAISGTETEYGSGIQCDEVQREVITISDDDDESNYGSDIDPATAEQLYGIASSKNLRLQLPQDRRKLGRTTAQTRCALLQLPPEIRTLIYEKTFEDFVAMWMTGTWYEPPGLLLSCKQVLDEAIPVFYYTATFRACSLNILERRILRLRYQHRRLVTKLQIDRESHHKDFLLEARVLHILQGSFDLLHIEVARQAEEDVVKAHALLRNNRSLRQIKLLKLEARMREADGTLIWSKDPTSVLARFQADESKSHDTR